MTVTCYIIDRYLDAARKKIHQL